MTDIAIARLARGAARRASSRQALEAWASLGHLLLQARRRLLLQPALAAAIALAETTAIVAVTRLLLLLASGSGSMSISFSGKTLTLTFAELSAVGAASSAVAILVRIAEARFTGALAARAIRNARLQVVQSWFDTEWQQLRDAPGGRLQQLLGVNCQCAGAPVTLFASVSLSVISLACYFSVIAVTAPTVLILFAIMATIVTGLFAPLRRANRRAASSAGRSVRDLQLTAGAYAGLLRELQLFGVTGAAQERLGQITTETYHSQRAVRSLSRMMPGVYQQLLVATVVGLVASAKLLGIDANAFGVASLLALRSLTYVQQLNTANTTYAESRPYVLELGSAIRLHSHGRRQWGTRELRGVSVLELRDISLGIGSTAVLKSLNVKIESGERIGVVGRSGSGKTTLASLLAGLLSPDEGEYLVNGRAARSYSLESWARQLAYVGQESPLLSASAAENIAFHRAASDSDVHAAAKRAAISDELDALPQGFDTPLGDGHANLSGGQRQRIAIARALLSSPTCLILDEPTSALDSHNASLVKLALQDVDRHTIIVIVTHTPALLRLCSRVLVIDDGRVAYDGPVQGMPGDIYQ